MPKIFLSHSSSDKEKYVRIVAKQLKENLDGHIIHFDEYTFEAGMKSIDEIEKSLNNTDLFVVFLSRSSLESDWVKRELELSKKLFNNGIIKRIYPIIIDQNLHWDDEMIPDWLKEYTLKYISKPTKATGLIIKRTIEINWELNPKIEEINNIFVGRNKEIDNFENRKYDYDMETAIAYIATGIPKCGRKSLLNKCFIKTNITEKNYRASKIELGMYDGIEDFILWTMNLGFSDNINITGFMQMEISDKCDILAKLLDDVSKNQEILMIEDKGCIITHAGEMCDWFKEVIGKMKETDRTVLGIASRFRLRLPISNKQIYAIDVLPLNNMECRALLQKYLELEDIKLSRDDFRNYSEMLKGFPEQVKYACSIIKKFGVNSAYNYSSDIENYDSEIVVQVLKDLKESKKEIEFLRFLAEIDTVSYQSLKIMLKDNIFFEEYIYKFYITGIIYFIGINNEYIKINESIKDYMMRSEYVLVDDYRNKLNNYFVDFIKKHKYEELDIPDYLLKLKKSLINGVELDYKYMLPSQYLKIMVELYEKGKDYSKVIEYADSVLERTRYIEKKLLFEIRCFLCMALAKRRDKRMLEEVQNIDGADHFFLLGFYYRMTGRYEDALEKLELALEKRKNFSKAKREKVQVLINLERFEDALSVAKENYENDRKNPYHIHAYFICLIKSDELDNHKVILEELISKLDKSASEFGIELRGRCKALFEAYVNKNSDIALAIINNTIKESYAPIYALQDKFDICEKTFNLNEMENVIKEIDNLKMRDSYGKERALYRAKLLYAAHRKNDSEIKKLVNEVKSGNVRINIDLLQKKIDRILNGHSRNKSIENYE